MQKKITLKKDQLNFLLIHIKNEDLINKLFYSFNKERIYENGYPTSRYKIDFCEFELKNILDELSLLLTSIGFDENDEINFNGEKIENIINTLYRE